MAARIAKSFASPTKQVFRVCDRNSGGLPDGATTAKKSSSIAAHRNDQQFTPRTLSFVSLCFPQVAPWNQAARHVCLFQVLQLLLVAVAQRNSFSKDGASAQLYS
jgi:hypothetical protein